MITFVADKHLNLTEVKAGTKTKLIAMFANGKPQPIDSVMGLRLCGYSDKKCPNLQRGNHLKNNNYLKVLPSLVQ